MHELPTPVDHLGAKYIAKDVFDLCISSIRNPALKNRLSELKPKIGAAANEYNEKATSVQMHTILQTTNVDDVSSTELKGVYRRMTEDDNSGREVYNNIRKSAKLERCPYCGLGVVKTLDHVLPQAYYTLLCVTPDNLVPSCRDCQSEKQSSFPSSEDSHCLHPYYDRFQSKRWLKSTVIQGTPAVFSYFVDESADFTTIQIQRLKVHMKSFDLANRFSIQASEELQNIKNSLRNLWLTGGANVVKDDLEGRASSSENILLNSWRSAMFRGGAESEWFCAGGFDLA